ncbi:MAG: hypothetical protein D6675_15955 [Gemmatimonadetes bacterium]|nr:MAG: hypothetical protein D6675_15955 [Gemmatimonadota bacterium]
MQNYSKYATVIVLGAVLVFGSGCASLVPPPADVSQKMADIESTQKEMATVKGDVEKMQGDITSLQSEVDREQQELDKLKAQGKLTEQDFTAKKEEAVKRMRGSGRSESQIREMLTTLGFNAQEIQDLLDRTR